MNSIYESLIRNDRLRETSFPNRNLTTEMLSDKKRILLSSAFRRLQTKAQVFSLEKNAAIRSRLTHTLEVALFGELIAEQIFDNLLEKGSVTEKLRRAFILSVENACLLHDIGNPPFGHLGEFAIRAWFEKKEKEMKRIWKSHGIRERTPEIYLDGFKNFDGNAQGFRIVSKLQWLDNEFGLNLTCTLLASIIKYLSSTPDQERKFCQKAGFYESERNLVTEIWKKLQLETTDSGLPLQRHPFTFIMEAADDIAYSINDIEDAIEKRVVSDKDFFDFMDQEGERNEEIREIKDKFYKATSVEEGNYHARYSEFTHFRIKLIRNHIGKVADSYVKNEEKILEGKFESSLIDADKETKATKKFLQHFAQKYIYTSHEAVEIELSGHRIIQTILDSFLPLLRLARSDFEKLDNPSDLKYGELALERRLYSLLPNKHLIAYKSFTEENEELEIVYRTHLIIDYLSGMTDGHAVKVFDILSGISTSATI